MSGRRPGWALCALALGVAALLTGRTDAAFNSSPGNADNAYSVAPDFVAPTIVRARAADPWNGPSYAVRQCRFYHAYAEATDAGNPASGVASVVADLSAVTGDLGADSLVAGSYSLDGLFYGWRSLPRLATSLPGGYGYDLVSTDHDGNSRREGDFPVTVGAGGMSAVYLTGLEQGVASAPGVFDTVTGSGVSADAAVYRHGSYSLRVAPSSAAAYASVTTGGSSRIAVVRFAVRLDSLPVATANLFSVVPSGGNTAFFAYNATSGRFGVRWGTGATVDGSVAPAAGTWYVIELLVNLASPRTLDWRIDAAEQTGASSVETARTVSGIGFGTTAANVAYTANFDDVIVSLTATDYPIGNGKVLPLAPDGMGTHNRADRFRNDDNSNINAASWGRVGETPANSPADFVKQVTANSASHVEFTFADTSEICINAVSALLAFHGAGTAGNNGSTRIFSGGTQTVVHTGAMNTTSLSHRRVVVSSGGGVWTTALVNALVARLGYSTDVSPNPYWDALLLEYDLPVNW